MTNNTQEKIIKEAMHLFATVGYESFSMRTLAKRINLSTSVLYHYFESKNDILKAAFEDTKSALGKRRPKLDDKSSLYSDIKSRVEYQLDNALDVTFILKYYLQYRDEFEKNAQGYVPKTAYKHILEVLEKAERNGEIKNLNLIDEAKVRTHAINGFVLEYYPNIPKSEEREKVSNSLTNFIYRSLKKCEEVKEK